MVVFFNLDLGIYQFFRAEGFSDLRFDGRIPISQLSNSGNFLSPFESNLQLLILGLSVLLRVNGGWTHGIKVLGFIALYLYLVGIDGDFDRLFRLGLIF